MKKITVILALFSAFCFMSIDANAQKYGKTPQDSVDCLMNNSLYQEFYKQKAYKDAYEPWKNVLNSCPAYHVNTYIRGLNILKNLYASATTQADKDRYFNEMIALFDTRAEAFGEKWNNIARQAEIYEAYKPTETKKIYELYAQAQQEADKNKAILDQAYCVEYLRATVKYVISLQDAEQRKEEMSTIFDVYDYASQAMEENLIQSSNELDSVTQLQDTKKMTKLQKEVDNTRSNMQALEALIEPYAKCDQIVPIYEDRFQKNPNDVALLKKITTNLESKGCMSSELFFQATENLHKIEPTPRSASLMGQMLMEKGQYTEAAKYLEESEKTAPEISTKSKAALALAQCLMRAKSYSAAREAARRAVSYNKSLAGKASVLIANMYLATPGQNAAWAAYDEAARARNIDPSVAADAQKIMNAAHGRFPAKKDLFFNNINVGSSVAVGGWIGGSTTVRSRD